LIESDYPRHYLGAVPVLVSTDYSSEPDDSLRTHVSLLNAYTWFKVDRFLRRVENLLRLHGYNDTLRVTQADGEVVDIPKVTPLKTCASDPIRFIKSMSDD
jgi:acetophenone carboxylase